VRSTRVVAGIVVLRRGVATVGSSGSELDGSTERADKVWCDAASEFQGFSSHDEVVLGCSSAHGLVLTDKDENDEVT